MARLRSSEQEVSGRMGPAASSGAGRPGALAMPGGAARLERDDGRGERTDALALGLGWFSIGLGLAEVAAPSSMARFIGVPDDDANCQVLRAAGMREIASGVGILAQEEPAGWMRARVAGDLMDLALLGAAMNSPSSRRGRVMMAAAGVLGVTFLDALSSFRLGHGAQRALERIEREPGVSIKQAVTIQVSPEQAYRFWRDFRNLPRFMSHLESVTVTDDGQSHWTARGPLRAPLAWDAEIIEDQINECIAWRSLGGDLHHHGRVRFAPAPGGRGTEVHVALQFLPPAGAIGDVLTRLFRQVPEQQIARDLRAFKQVLETGEVLHSDASRSRLPHPARPSGPSDQALG